jgi:hypothetical protein
MYLTLTNPIRSANFSACRRNHRTTCILAGGLAICGGILALLVHPGFAVVAAIGGLWLILAPESKACAG